LLKVGLTGGIASGKSIVGEMFSTLGAHLIKADEIAHQLMRPGETVYRAVVHHFGPEILNSDKTINRAKLAEAAFGSFSGGAAEKPSRIQELNQLVHPAVIQYHDNWMTEIGRSNPRAIAVVEAALLLEAHAEKSFDQLVVVTCLPKQRVERWAERMKVDEANARKEVARRMAAQLSDEEKMKYADYVIDNSGSLGETRQQVETIYREFEKQTANPRL
jgi:dephospho-CoA kinase